MTYTSEQLFDSYEKATPLVRALLGDENLGPYVFGVCSKYGVAGDKALDIEDIVVHTLLGLAPLPDLRKSIREDTGVSAEQAENIVAEFEKTMFPLAGIGVPAPASVNQPATPPSPISSPAPIAIPMATKGAPPENLPVSAHVVEQPITPSPTLGTSARKTSPLAEPIPPAPLPPSAYAQPIVPAGYVLTPQSDRLTPRDIFEKKLRAAQELGLAHEPAPLPEVPRPPHAVPGDTSENPPPKSVPYKGMDPYKELPGL